MIMVNKRAIVAGALVLILVALIYQLMLLWVSALFANQANLLVSQWKANLPERPSIESVNLAQEKMRFAIGLNANDATLHRYMATLYEWKAYSKGRAPGDQRDDLNNSIRYYQSGLRHRPTHADLLAGWAKIKLRLAEFDDELEKILKDISVLAPWEYHIHGDLTDTALKVWPRISDRKVRKLLRNSIKVAMRRDAKKILGLSIKYGRGSLPCTLGYDTDEIKDVCTKYWKRKLKKLKK